MKKILLAIIGLGMITSLSQAQMKVGMVDLNRAFDAYYKTAESKARVSELEASYKKERQLKMTDYQKLADEYDKLKDDAQNPALAESVQEAKRKATMEKAKELQLREKEITQFNNERQNEIQTTMMRLRDGIVKEITKVVQDYASKNGYTLVFDKTAQSMAAAPIIVYSSDSMDFTDSIIKILNANKPSSSSNSGEKKDQ
ncbi:MAG: OmpH family outer membrane protein [Verrucomicrobiia bacterium]